jgi:hypothetical protein
MFGFVAAVLFAVAFIISGAAIAVTSAWFAPLTLVCAGLVCLALHVSGVGSGWMVRRS